MIVNDENGGDLKIKDYGNKIFKYIGNRGGYVYFNYVNKNKSSILKESL